MKEWKRSRPTPSGWTPMTTSPRGWSPGNGCTGRSSTTKSRTLGAACRQDPERQRSRYSGGKRSGWRADRASLRARSRPAPPARTSFDPPMSVSIDQTLRDELKEGRDLREHWLDDMPVFNVRPRPAQPGRYRSGRSFAARNPHGGPDWGFTSKTGALLLPNVPAPALHQLLDAVEAEIIASDERLQQFLPRRSPSPVVSSGRRVVTEGDPVSLGLSSSPATPPTILPPATFPLGGGGQLRSAPVRSGEIAPSSSPRPRLASLQRRPRRPNGSVMAAQSRPARSREVSTVR